MQHYMLVAQTHSIALLGNLQEYISKKHFLVSVGSN